MTDRTHIAEGRTVEDAINKALAKLKLPRDRVNVEVLEKPRSVLGIMRNPAKVKVAAKDSRDAFFTTSSTSATVAVVEGELRYTAPTGNGDSGSLLLGDNIEAIYDGKHEKNRIELDKGLNTLELSLPSNVEPSLEIDMRVSDNGLEAMLYWKRIHGVIFSLKDHQPAPMVRLELLAEKVAPPKISLDDIEQRVREAGIRFGLKLDELSASLLEQTEGSITIAEGQPPAPGTPGKIDFLLEKANNQEVDLDATRIDHYDVRSVVSVDEGTVLARKIPSIPGEPGRNVFGEEIPPQTVKDVDLRVGEGVKLSEDGLQAIASRPGLPLMQSGTLKVLKVYEVQGDADVSTGHIRFKGEVIVRGNVCEKIQIQAVTGGVHVTGMVSSASITADGDVVIDKNAIATKISAGGATVISLKLLSFLHSINSGIGLLLRAFAVVRDQTNDSDGKLLKNLLELKFHSIPRKIREMQEYFATIANQVSPESSDTMQQLANIFLGRGPLEIQDISVLQTLYSQLKAWEESLKDESQRSADIRVRYLQNSRLDCSGKAYVSGQGGYYSQIMAGHGVYMERGVFRGGRIIVDRGEINVKELGGPTGVPTEVYMVNSGNIYVGKVYPNVTISIKHQKYKFDQECSAIKAFWHEDSLKVYTGALELH